MTRGQLLGLGWGRDTIKSRVRSGELIPVHLGVYAVGHVPLGAHPRSMAAVLACGPGAVLSHAAAVALYGLGEWPATLEVTAPAQRRRAGIATHRSGSLARGDVWRHHGIPVTSPVRTILDVQSRRADAGLQRLVNEARLAHLLGPSALEELMARSVRITNLIGDPEQRPTRSEIEDLFRRFAKRHRLPAPVTNAIIRELGNREVDAFYPAEKLILELDGFRFHGNRRRFESDRELDVDALAAGYATVRITKRRLANGGKTEAARIRTILADRGPD